MKCNYILFNIISLLILFIILGKKVAGEISESSRSVSPILDDGVMKFTPTGLYFLPESVKLLSPSLAESQHHGTNH